MNDNTTRARAARQRGRPRGRARGSGRGRSPRVNADDNTAQGQSQQDPDERSTAQRIATEPGYLLSTAASRKRQVTEPDLDPLLTDALDEFVSAFGKSSAKMSARIQAAKRQKTDNVPLFPSCLQDPGWSEADESKAQEFWRADMSTREHIPTSITSEYQGVWKDCLQFFNCTPFDIAGAMHNLRFQTNSTQSKRSNSSQMWSVNFCMQLRRLITHSAWSIGSPKTGPSKLSTMIQYAVILRTGDQRPWDLGSFEDNFFKPLHQLCYQRSSKRDCHAEVYTQYMDKGLDIPLFSLVMRSLEKVVIVANAENLESSDAHADTDADVEYRVTTNDLKNVIQALDDMEDLRTGMSLFLPTELQHRAALQARGFNPEPKTLPELKMRHRNALVEECRRRVLKAKVLSAQPVSVPQVSSPMSIGDGRSSPISLPIRMRSSSESRPDYPGQEQSFPPSGDENLDIMPIDSGIQPVVTETNLPSGSNVQFGAEESMDQSNSDWETVASESDVLEHSPTVRLDSAGFFVPLASSSLRMGASAQRSPELGTRNLDSAQATIPEAEDIFLPELPFENLEYISCPDSTTEPEWV